MLVEKRNPEESRQGRAAELSTLAILTTVLACCLSASPAQRPGQQTFPSADEATKALIEALRANDQSALLSILGPAGKEVIFSGDPVEDKTDRAEFVEKYQQMHRLVIEENGTITLYIGDEELPTPIPLVHAYGSWHFDTAAGKKEILYRRVGKNELAVIQVCHKLVEAEKAYYAQPHDGNAGKEYARKFTSDPRTHDGLYWDAAAGETQSPLGPLMASAAAEGYIHQFNEEPQPFHGYYFRILTRQNGEAHDAPQSYIVNGKMTGGFAFLAYPAGYRSSGVMTFIVCQDGIVFEKDLGARTAQVAKTITGYGRDSTWRKAD